MFTPAANPIITAGGRRFTRSPLRTAPVAPVWQPDPLTTPIPADAWRALQLGRCAEKVRIQAFARGCRELGGQVMTLDESYGSKLDQVLRAGNVALCFTSGMHAPEDLARGLCAGHGVPLVILDLGYLKRAQHPQDAGGYNQVGLNHSCWIPPTEQPADRWEALGVELKPPRPADRPPVALVLGQMPNDSQHGLTAMQLIAYLSERAAFWHARGYAIHYRPHPAAMVVALRGVGSVTLRQSNEESLARALTDARVAVTFNSTAGLEALLEGVPVDCAPTAHYAEVASYGWEETPESPPLARSVMEAYLHRLAYGQWTVPELQAGAPLRFLAPLGIPKLQAILAEHQKEATS